LSDFSLKARRIYAKEKSSDGGSYEKMDRCVRTFCNRFYNNFLPKKRLRRKRAGQRQLQLHRRSGPLLLEMRLLDL
jgi:hypothetical protein